MFSDPVLLQIIALLSVVVTSVTGMVVAIVTGRTNSRKIADTNQKIAAVEDGIKSALVKATERAAVAEVREEGAKQGQVFAEKMVAVLAPAPSIGVQAVRIDTTKTGPVPVKSQARKEKPTTQKAK